MRNKANRGTKNTEPCRKIYPAPRPPKPACVFRNPWRSYRGMVSEKYFNSRIIPAVQLRRFRAKGAEGSKERRYRQGWLKLDRTAAGFTLLKPTPSGMPRLHLTGLPFHHYVLETSANLSSPAN